jgi:hypothetical protein
LEEEEHVEKEETYQVVIEAKDQSKNGLDNGRVDGRRIDDENHGSRIGIWKLTRGRSTPGLVEGGSWKEAGEEQLAVKGRSDLKPTRR